MNKKRMRVLVGIFCMQTLFIAGCGKNTNQLEGKEITRSKTNSYNIVELSNIADDFSLQDAKDAGMLVLENMTITSGLNQWNEFYENAASGRSDEVMIAKYYEIGNESQYSPELYEEIKDDYPILYVFSLKYDGSVYTLSYYEDSKLYTYDYPYMIERVGHLSPTAAVAEHFFALVNDKELSYHDIKWSMLSSNLADKVDYRDVFAESISLENYNSRKPGTYRSEDGGATLILDENCQFSFSWLNNDSPSGRYSTEGDKLVLRVTDEEEYHFKLSGYGTLEFVSGDSGEDKVGIGTKFKYEIE
jgi:hypothetical protein